MGQYKKQHQEGKLLVPWTGPTSESKVILLHRKNKEEIYKLTICAHCPIGSAISIIQKHLHRVLQ
jgi:hypothetical protein